MDLIRINPIKILVSGNRDRAQNFIGAAKSQLEILKKQMTFQNLTQAVRRVWLLEDVYVECTVCHDYEECRIWAQEFSEEEVTYKDVYFYVRITHSIGEGGSAATFLTKPKLLPEYEKDIDRLIIYKVQEEIKSTEALNAADYIETGEYENGNFWGIVENGSIVLDVDVISRTVYSSMGDIDVDNNLDEASQLTLADKYIEQITTGKVQNGFLPQDITVDFYPSSGPILSPWHIVTECRKMSYDINIPSGTYGEWTIIDPIMGVDPYGDPCEFYHVNVEPVAAPDIGCNPPSTTFYANQWPKVDVNKYKYPKIVKNPTSTEYHSCGPIIDVLYVDVSSPEPGCKTIVINQGSENNCDLDENNSVHFMGLSYYTGNKYPCFFILTAKTITAQTTTIHGVVDRGSYYSSVRNSTGVIHGSRAQTHYYISTPLEEKLYTREFVVGPDADPGKTMGKVAQQIYNWGPEGCNITVQQAEEWYDLRANCFTYAQQSKNDMGDPWIWGAEHIAKLPEFVTYAYSHIDPWAIEQGSFLGVYAGGTNLPIYTDRTIEHTLSIVSRYKDKKTPKKLLVSMVLFFDLTGYASAAITGSWNFDRTAEGGDWEYNFCRNSYNEQPGDYPTDPAAVFQTGAAFYFIHPEFNFREVDGVMEYWDIHDERESDQDEINHCRALDLEEYVGEVLKYFKELFFGTDPQADPLIDRSNQYADLNLCDLDMTTGFVYQLH